MQYAQLPPAKIEYHGIRFTPEGVFSTVHGKPLEFYPKAEISDIRLRRALRAEAPLIQVLVGLGLTGAGVFGLYRLLYALLFGGFAHGWDWWAHWPLLLLLLLPLGGRLAVTAFRQKMCLVVVTDHHTHKLFFQGELDHPEVMHFLKQATEMGFPLTTEKAMFRSGPET